MGTDEGDAVLQMRNETIPGMGRVFTAWHGITRPEPGRTMAPIWINTPAEARKAVQDLSAKDVDIIKVWVDDRNGMYPKVTPDQIQGPVGPAQERTGADKKDQGQIVITGIRASIQASRVAVLTLLRGLAPDVTFAVGTPPELAQIPGAVAVQASPVPFFSSTAKRSPSEGAVA